MKTDTRKTRESPRKLYISMKSINDHHKYLNSFDSRSSFNIRSNECKPADITRMTPQWHNPCGSGRSKPFYRMIDKKMWTKRLGKSLRKIQQQLNITIEHYKSQMFETKYSEVRLGVDENQYVPNWVPGKGNVFIHFGMHPTRLRVSGYLPSLHTELQKFAVAMEAILETDNSIVFSTNSYLIQFLCEVEEALVIMQIAVPMREERSLMAYEERHPPDETNRLIRDWGILIKYRDYLHEWNVLLSKMDYQHKKQKKKDQVKQKNKKPKRKFPKKH